MSINSRYKIASNYLLATRPWSLSASVTPALLGNLIAKTEFNNFDWSIFMISLLCVVFVHCGGNLVNTYYDYQNNVDNSLSDDLTLVKKYIEPDSLFWFFIVLYGFGSFFFVTILKLSNCETSHLFILFISGFICSFFYTGSFGLKYHALGEIVIALAFGPISVLFPFIAQTGIASFLPVLYVIPLVINTEAILHGNNARDAEDDKKSGIVTVSILIGEKYSHWFYTLLLFLPYFFVFTLIAIKSFFFSITFLTLPFALKLENCFCQNLKCIPKQTAMLNLNFGFFYLCAFVLDFLF
ncbi:ubiA prenyltransferase domain-containing protein 1 isoform X1 [Hydra vulgaris]|nr:ubiA prenyltransferase domain-containing protein 1-like [Hydra vulgaris]